MCSRVWKGKSRKAREHHFPEDMGIGSTEELKVSLASDALFFSHSASPNFKIVLRHVWVFHKNPFFKYIKHTKGKVFLFKIADTTQNEQTKERISLGPFQMFYKLSSVPDPKVRWCCGRVDPLAKIVAILKSKWHSWLSWPSKERVASVSAPHT